MPPMPQIGLRHDLNVFQNDLQAAADEFTLPYEIVCAQAFTESSWKLKAYRYEPNYDRRYVTGHTDVWSRDIGWMSAGPTVEYWFRQHPERSKEHQNYGWNFVAQTRIASSYGPMQLMYPTAKDLGFKGCPEQLWEPVSVRLGVVLLAANVTRALNRGLVLKDAIACGLAAYNGGPLGNSDPTQLRNIEYVRAVNRNYKLCWGSPFFEL